MGTAAQADTRSLKLYYTHTGEKAEIVFKRNGRYDQGGLKKLNRFLRDWRRNEPTKMDPRLFDLIWEVYRQAGTREYIHVISAYRSPKTNEMLRRTRGGQAKKSQHILGKAMDFYIPGVKLAKLREIGMKVQGGGVGYYPKSGSPFVHLDVGSVRAWPRMSRQELVRIFPDGKTMHLPPDGKPLPKYNQALAEYKARGGGAIASSGGGSSGSGKGGNLFAALFGGDEDEGDDSAPAKAAVPAPAAPQREVAALTGFDESAPDNAPALIAELPVNAPVPVSRPSLTPDLSTETALVAPQATVPAQQQIDAFAAAAAAVPTSPVTASASTIPDFSTLAIPVPQLLADRAAPAPTAAAETTEVAALDVPSKASDAFVPLPIRRPGETGGDSRSPTLAAVVNETPGMRKLPSTTPSPDSWVELAELAPQEKALRGGRIASAFAPVPQPRKGARPSAADAGKGQITTRLAAPKLTEKIIAGWALDREEAETAPVAKVRGERFVASQLQAAPEEVYAAGFIPNGTSQPHNRFTGSAVNFIQIARFGPSS
ncbi:MAG: ATP/GTP-binding protein [Rhizobiales bacterium]|nr:ATP/GTP-binding protein [Hyphomicrobiales bacterium]MBA70618.1 ATP/GTP-binding protein [Hyphomicrobiales bacterium]